MERADTARRGKGRWTAALLVLLSVFVAVPNARPAAGADLGGAPIRVGIGRSLTQVSVSAEGDAAVWAGDGTALAPVTAGQAVEFALSGSSVAVRVGGADIGAFSGPVRLVSASPAGLLVRGSRRYRGEFEVLANQTGKLSLVNVVPLEDYLRGVREMPAGWPAEALKAQAVASRTYAVAQMLSGKYRGEGFDVTDNTESQVYQGVSGEDPRSDAAVAATAGEVIMYDGTVITAYYHAASGGHTEDNEVVWNSGGQAIPYLRGVPDFDNGSPDYSWQIARTSSQVAEALRASTLAADVGEVYEIAATGRRGTGGRWSQWTISGSRGQQKLSGEDLRRVLGLRASPREVTVGAAWYGPRLREYPTFATVSVLGEGGQVRAMTVDRVAVVGGDGVAVAPAGPWVATAGAPQSLASAFFIGGGGWGHGVGMSQWGARGLAEQGKTYPEILTHYYTGTQVTAWPGP